MNKDLVLNGTWEQEHKNPLLGSFILVFLCGSIYFFLQSMILNSYLMIDMRVNGGSFAEGASGYFEIMAAVYRNYRVVLLISTGVSQYLFLLALPLWLFRKWHSRNIVRYFQYDRVPVPGILLSVGGIVLTLPLVDEISRVFYNFFPLLEKVSAASEPLFQADNPGQLLFILLVISLTPAVCEEALFRGYFQRTLQRRLRFPWHFLISGLIFALYHQSPLSLPALFLVGAYLGYVYYAFDSLYVSMASHLVYNLLIVLSVNAEELPQQLFRENGRFHLPVVLSALLLFAALVVGIYFYAVRKKQQQPDETRQAADPADAPAEQVNEPVAQANQSAQSTQDDPPAD